MEQTANRGDTVIRRKLQGVSDTLFIPLAARIFVSKNSRR
jgi:hypothetical protein